MGSDRSHRGRQDQGTSEPFGYEIEDWNSVAFCILIQPGLMSVYKWHYFYFFYVTCAGLSTPVPRGRKGKKMKIQSSSFDIQKAEWIRKHNPEHMLSDDGYKKHLKHHCNKWVLHRKHNIRYCLIHQKCGVDKMVFLKEACYVYQCCINLINNTVKQ